MRTPEGLSLEGGLPAELLATLADFPTPLLHADGRSLAIGGLDTAAVDRAPGVAWGGTTRFGIDTILGAGPRWFDAGTSEVTVAGPTVLPGVGSGVRLGILPWLLPARVPVDPAWQLAGSPRIDARIQDTLAVSRRLAIDVILALADDATAYHTDRAEHPDAAVDGARTTVRGVLREHVRGGAWQAELAQSVLYDARALSRGLVQHHDDTVWAFEERNQLARTFTGAGGLARLVWKVGLDAHVARHDLAIADASDPRENVATALAGTGAITALGTFPTPPTDDVSHTFHGVIWTPDLATWTEATAQLSPELRAIAGVRVDAFGTTAIGGPGLARGGAWFADDVAVEPRGRIEARISAASVVALDAGASRRAPELGEELEHPELHPERTTRIALAFEHAAAAGPFGALSAYYLDRTRLIEQDGAGNLANTGRGTTYGVLARLGVHRAHWVAIVALALERSERQVTPRSQLRPFEDDQPVRLDARVTRFVGAWQLGAHFELREGLPYTEVVGASYDSDRDLYLPNFGPLYAQRLPWQHQLDLRADRAVLDRGRLAIYVDVANVYAHRDQVGWQYSFDYAQRRPLEGASILPTVGVRGTL